MKRRGWFSITGIQDGEHAVKDRLSVFPDFVRAGARDAHILDVGCAEGLLSQWLIDNCGAASIDGLEVHQPYIDLATKLFAGYDARIHQVDIKHLAVWLEQNPGVLRDKYEIVLALRIMQKMPRPEDTLMVLSRLCEKFLIIETPDPAINDHRSNYKKLEIEPVMNKLGFALVHSARDKVRVWQAVFKRKASQA